MLALLAFGHDPAAAEAPPGAAPTPAARAKAVELVKRGAAHMEAGEYAEALALYEQAYAIVPSPKIKYNVASAYEGLARYAQAHDAYEDFLREAKDAAPEFVKRAEARLGALAHRLGTVVIVVDGALSSLHIDGRSVDPARASFKLEPGEHTAIGRAAEKSAWQTFTLSAGDRKRIALQLKAEEPPAAVVSPPPALTVQTAAPGPEAALQGASEQADETEARPLYRRPWVVAGAAAAVLAAGAAVFFATRGPEYPSVDRSVSW